MKNKKTDIDRNTQYWATFPVEDLLPIIMETVEDYYEKLESTGMLRLWKDSYNVYYGLSETSGSHESSKVSFVGDNEESILVRSGHMGNILQHIYVSATAQETNFIPRAINNDYRSKAQTYSAKSILEYYMNELEYGAEIKSAAERALVFGRGYVYQGWDIIENDIFVQAHSPLTVITDLNNNNPRKQQWCIIIERVNKWDIVAKYNVKEDDVEELVGDQDNTNQYWVGFEEAFVDNDDSDYINVYHFYHRKSPSIPNGRYVACVNSTVAIYPSNDKQDDRLPYVELPLYSISPRDMIAAPYGYSPAFDIIAHDKLHNAVLSTIHTQINTFGTKWLAGPIIKNFENIGGMNYIPVPSGERAPAILDFTPISETLFKLLEIEQSQMEVLSAVNSAVRGEAKDQKSGSHAALLHSVAVQYQQGYHQSYNRLLRRCGTGILRLIKEFSDSTKLIEIVGADGEPYLSEFSKADISNIDRVIVENGNPLLNTMAGKLHLADSMLEKGIITGPEDYQDVLDTGQIQGALISGRHKNSGIQSENELLMKPETLNITVQSLKAFDGVEYQVEVVNEVRALKWEDHKAHIAGHYPIVLHPVMKQDPKLIKAVSVHIDEHIWLSQHGSREALIATGQQPFPDVNQINKKGSPRNQISARQLDEKFKNGFVGKPNQGVPDPNYPISGLPNMPDNPIGV